MAYESGSVMGIFPKILAGSICSQDLRHPNIVETLGFENASHLVHLVHLVPDALVKNHEQMGCHGDFYGGIP